MSDSHSDLPETDGAANKRNTLRVIMMVAAFACLLGGLLMGLLALAGPIAVWLGMADFRLGFGLLQTVNAWADRIALLALVVAIAILIVARTQQVAGGGRLASFAFIGVVVAGLAWFIPETFRPPEGTPPIHDIATNPDAPLQYEAIAPLRADAPNNMDYGVMDGITVEEHRRAQLEAYPEIQPQQYSAPPDEIFDRALAVAEDMGWEIVEADRAAGRIEATDTTFWFRFKDDVVVEVRQAPGGSVLNARSLSRVGRSDVGKNAARLSEYFERIRES